MDQKKRHLASMATGAVVGLLVAAVMQPGRPFSDGQAGVTAAALVAFGMVNGGLIGALASYLCHGFHRLEQCVLVLLTSIGLAALSVIVGPFGESSAVPAMLYGVALLNGVILGPSIRLVANWITTNNVSATS